MVHYRSVLTAAVAVGAASSTLAVPVPPSGDLSSIPNIAATKATAPPLPEPLSTSSGDGSKLNAREIDSIIFNDGIQIPHWHHHPHAHGDEEIKVNVKEFYGHRHNNEQDEQDEQDVPCRTAPRLEHEIQVLPIPVPIPEHHEDHAEETKTTLALGAKEPASHSLVHLERRIPSVPATGSSRPSKMTLDEAWSYIGDLETPLNNPEKLRLNNDLARYVNPSDARHAWTEVKENWDEFLTTAAGKKLEAQAKEPQVQNIDFKQFVHASLVIGKTAENFKGYSINLSAKIWCGGQDKRPHEYGSFIRQINAEKEKETKEQFFKNTSVNDSMYAISVAK
ncbi:hypothetical protein GG344DRAFT_64703 [Lentinula edodes]|nr:hypothetical protein GG344DRAFT_64703 [Lentinula edodes]